MFADESGVVTRVTFADLRERVRRCAAALRRAGIRVGDRVVGYIANCAEAVVAMLAATSIGAIWSSTSPDFGVKGVLERFTQIEPRIIFSVNAVLYNGKVFDHLEKLREVVSGLSTVERVVVVPVVPSHTMDLSSIPNGMSMSDFELSGRCSDGGYPPLEFEQLPFDHPGFILFSSGTTGHPKCIVHAAAGPLLQHKKEHIIHGDMRRDDILFQYTTAGWMMWNWLVSALSVGASIVLYDGSPLRPTPAHLFKLIDELGITMYGTSAKFLASLEELGFHPNEHASLASLKVIYSTGSPLKPESYDYVYTHIKSNVCLASITGGTDIVSLFAGGNTTLPVYRGEVQCRNLGMKVECFSDDGLPLMGQRGDLVCTRPFPCQPVFFWNDPDGSKYTKAYFAAFPGVWYHGDFLVINPVTGGVVMLGRSDGTLNPGGVRIGSAELYNLVEAYEEVADCLVVGQPWHDDERVVMFLKMAGDKTVSRELVARLKDHIRKELSPRHVPSFILPISDIPVRTFQDMFCPANCGMDTVHNQWEKGRGGRQAHSRRGDDRPERRHRQPRGPQAVREHSRAAVGRAG